MINYIKNNYYMIDNNIFIMFTILAYITKKATDRRLKKNYFLNYKINKKD